MLGQHRHVEREPIVDAVDLGPLVDGETFGVSLEPRGQRIEAPIEGGDQRS